MPHREARESPDFPGSLLGSYSHKEQQVRQINQREASINLILILKKVEGKGKERKQKRNKKKSREAIPGFGV